MTSPNAQYDGVLLCIAPQMQGVVLILLVAVLGYYAGFYAGFYAGYYACFYSDFYSGVTTALRKYAQKVDVEGEDTPTQTINGELEIRTRVPLDIVALTDQLSWCAAECLAKADAMLPEIRALKLQHVQAEEAVDKLETAMESKRAVDRQIDRDANTMLDM